MKKYLIAIILLLIFAANGWCQPTPPGAIFQDGGAVESFYPWKVIHNCTQTLNADGSISLDCTAAGAGDITSVWADDTGDVSALTAAAGDSLNATSADSSIPFKAGLAAAIPATCTQGMTYLATNTNVLSICTAPDTWTAWGAFLALVIGTNVQAWDADLDYLATFTPTANVKTILNAANFAAIQASLSIDDLITLSGVVEGEPDLGTFTGTTIADDQTIKQALQALETSVELKAPIASPTFTGVAIFPNVGLTVLDTGGDHELIIKPGSDLGADRILTITTGDAARTLTIGGDSTVNQDVSNTANPAFSTANLTGASALSLGTSRTNDGKITLKSGTALNDFVFTITGGNFGADLAWALPLAAPEGANYLLNVDADGTMGYTDPASIGALASDCSVGPCLDGSSDGGTYVAMYDGDSHWTKLAAGNSAANLTFTFPTAVAGGNNYLLNFDADGTGGFTDPSTFQAADATLTALAALVSADVTIIAGTGADTYEIVTSGGNYYFLGSNVDNTAIAFQALTLDLVADTATSQKIAAADVNATGHVTVLTDIDDTGGITVTGLSATRAITVDDAAQELAARNRANTFTENNTIGNADTDTLTLRSLLLGGNTRAVQIASAIASPTYATDAYSLYVGSYIESGTGVIAPFFESILTAGNVGYLRFKEDPTYGSNYRGLTAKGGVDYTENLEWVVLPGVPSANDIPVFGAVAANQTEVSYQTLPELMATVFGTDAGYVITYSGGNWTSAPVTATAPGDAGHIPYNDGADGFTSEAGFNYNAATDLFSVGSIALGADPADAGSIRLSNATYIMSEADVAGVDISVIGVDASEVIQIGASGASGVTITPAVILTGGITSTAAAWNLSGGTGTLGVLAGSIDAGGATSFEIVNGDNPTTDAAGEIAMDTTGTSIQGLNVYANATPGAIRVPFYQPDSMTIANPVAASDYPLRYTEYAITLRAIRYMVVGGTNWVGQIQICDANYGTCGDTQAADSTVSTGTTTSVTSFSDATIPAGVWYGLKTTSTSGSPTSVTASYSYTMDQQ